jgi:hypothetical protein
MIPVTALTEVWSNSPRLVSSKLRKAMIPWVIGLHRRALDAESLARDRWFADSPLEEGGLELRRTARHPADYRHLS